MKISKLTTLRKKTELPIKEDSKILYIGASHGVTVNLLSDLVPKGHIFAVEISPLTIQNLLFLADKKKNISPIIADANKPETYKDLITEVDLIYQDIAQKNQIEILFKNLQFLKKDGFIILMLKLKSISSTLPNEKIFQKAKDELSKKLKIVNIYVIETHKDHVAFILNQ